jgi:hypothetical protein
VSSLVGKTLLPALWAACLIPVITNLLAQDDGGARVCDHGTRGLSTQVDLDAVEQSLKRAESSIKLSLSSGPSGGDLQSKVGTDFPVCRTKRRVDVRLESPAPKAVVGTRLIFMRSDDLREEALPAKKTALVIVGVQSLSETIRISTSLKGKPDLGVYLASPEMLKMFGVDCVPATLTFSSSTNALVEMGSR